MSVTSNLVLFIYSRYLRYLRSLSPLSVVSQPRPPDRCDLVQVAHRQISADSITAFNLRCPHCSITVPQDEIFLIHIVFTTSPPPCSIAPPHVGGQVKPNRPKGHLQGVQTAGGVNNSPCVLSPCYRQKERAKSSQTSRGVNSKGGQVQANGRGQRLRDGPTTWGGRKYKK